MAAAVPRRYPGGESQLRRAGEARGFGQLLLCEEGAARSAGQWSSRWSRHAAPMGGRPKPRPAWGDLQIGGRVFTLTVLVAFRLGKDTDPSGQQEDMIRLADAVLARVPGDAVLHLDYEDVWMACQDGHLTLSERSDLWPRNRLAGVSEPYRRQTHEFVDEN
ncbi:SitI3 family protein [Kitasatospora sp. NPDC056446]|uniref:SitI3 family protein n=1 Tax=Kitasatospora sp. NPDC056446 TaxID=3345819 RepID=UPI003689ECD3